MGKKWSLSGILEELESVAIANLRFLHENPESHKQCLTNLMERFAAARARGEENIDNDLHLRRMRMVKNDLYAIRLHAENGIHSIEAELGKGA